MSPHRITGHNLLPPFPQGLAQALFGLGCFWGAERLFWQQPGIFVTAVGYAGGTTPNPSYRDVCSGTTGHAEVVLVVFDPEQISYRQLLKVFWESHDPTQGNRQGNDFGTQYRSMILTFDEQQRQQAQLSRDIYQQLLNQAGCPIITTEIASATRFHYAEDEHQQYLAKHPTGYCGLGGLGIEYHDQTSSKDV